MKKIFIIYFLIIFKLTFSQNEKIYFDQNWKPTTKENPSFYRTWQKINDSSYTIQDHFITGEKQMEAHSKSITPSNFFDKVTFYYKSGGKQSEGIYVDNKKTGLWQWWYEDGKLQEEGQFDKQGGNAGLWKGYHNNGKPSFEAKYVQGKMDGVCKWYHSNGQLSSEETYEKGDLKKIKQWEKNGTDKKGNMEVEVKPEFPGGADGFWEYIKKNMKYPKEAKDKGIAGIVSVNFIIDTIGKVTNVSIKENLHPLLDAEAERLIKQMPRWVPGNSHNRISQFSFTQPINFGLKNYDYIITYNNDTIKGEILRVDALLSGLSFKLKATNGNKEGYDGGDAKEAMYRGTLFKAKPTGKNSKKRIFLRVLMKNKKYELCRNEHNVNNYIYENDDELAELKAGNTKEILLQYFNNCGDFTRLVSSEKGRINLTRLDELTGIYNNFKCEKRDDKE